MNNKYLKGFKEYNCDSFDEMLSFNTVSYHNFDPPAYVVASIFFDELGYKNYGRLEKEWWHTFFEYKEHKYLIRDYKFESWSIDSNEDINIIEQYIPEIIKKIKAASYIVDKKLQKKFRQKIEAGEFYIRNNLGDIQRMFKYYRNDYIQHKDQENFILKYIPLLISFFSYLEFTLDVFYAFMKIDISFPEYRNKIWQDRFKYVFNLGDSGLLKIYDELVNIKNNMRNPIMHGLTNESCLLVSSQYEGLVPLSYEYIKNKLEYNMTNLSEIMTTSALNTFDNYIKFIENTVPYKYFIHYCKKSFEIPVNHQKIDNILDHMQSESRFIGWIEGEILYQDKIWNREI